MPVREREIPGGAGATNLNGDDRPDSLIVGTVPGGSLMNG
jgi:hypothetical protein